MPPAEPDDTAATLRPDAVRIEGLTGTGKCCALVDNTGDGLPRDELERLLADLGEGDAFGFRALSPAGGGTITLDAWEFGHVHGAARRGETGAILKPSFGPCPRVSRNPAASLEVPGAVRRPG